MRDAVVMASNNTPQNTRQKTPKGGRIPGPAKMPESDRIGDLGDLEP